MIRIYEGQDLAKAKLCDTNFECYGLRTCQRAPGYCENGNCKCLTLQAMYTHRADVNHLARAM